MCVDARPLTAMMQFGSPKWQFIFSVRTPPSLLSASMFSYTYSPPCCFIVSLTAGLIRKHGPL